MLADRPALHVVGAAIVRDGACLAAQRGPDAPRCALQWEFPGGKVEADEAPEAALRREIREELTVEIEVGPWLGRGTDDSDGVVIALDVFVARLVSGEVRLTEHHRYGWFCAEEIDSLEWAAADQPILPALKRLLRAPQKLELAARLPGPTHPH